MRREKKFMANVSAWDRASPGSVGHQAPKTGSPTSRAANTDWPPAGSFEGTDQPAKLHTDFVGTRWPLFWLALKTGVFTVLTLGIYRFWMKTRLRRWFWSATRPGGTPLEYVGDPFEKLLGFLIAVVILAFYIGVVNLLLMFASFSLFQQNFTAYLVSFLGVIPLWFYATYRARRYVLARTRWRGVRFGLAPGAWGYTWRAIVHWTITILSAGILWPRMTFWLEKYRTDRTWYGDARLEQGGRWTMLYTATKPMWIAVAFAACAVWADLAAHPGTAIVLFAMAGVLAVYGITHYRVTSRAILANHKSAGGVGLVATPSAPYIFGIAAFGYAATAVVLALPVSALSVGVAIVQFAQTDVMGDLGNLGQSLSALPQPLLIAIGIGLYFAIFLLWSSFTHVWVTMPVWRHYARHLEITNPEKLTAISQRARDEFEEAEGFAEALDVGASL